MGLYLKTMQPALLCVLHLRLVAKRKLLLLFLCCVGIQTILFAQQSTVTGKVTDEKANPLTGASVKISGSHTGVITNTDGNFSIKATKGQTLEISYVGKVDQKIVVGDNPTIDVTMKDQTGSDLNEVIVTGYMTQRKADLTGAVSVVSSKDLKKDHGVTNIMQ
jgi:hypothetical protein